jgi:hypothetical protein
MSDPTDDFAIGDEVFIVEPKNKTWTSTVCRIGRRYIYVKLHGREAAFDKEMRVRKRDEWPASRIYKSRDEWEREQNDRGEFVRLKHRLNGGYEFVHLSPSVVRKIHAVLDEEECQ